MVNFLLLLKRNSKTLCVKKKKKKITCLFEHARCSKVVGKSYHSARSWWFPKTLGFAGVGCPLPSSPPALAAATEKRHSGLTRVSRL